MVNIGYRITKNGFIPQYSFDGESWEDFNINDMCGEFYKSNSSIIKTNDDNTIFFNEIKDVKCFLNSIRKQWLVDSNYCGLI